MLTTAHRKWRTYSGHSIDKPILEKVEETIIEERKKGHNLKLCIGTDSQKKGDHVHFASVILFLREKKGGFMYISSAVMEAKMSLKERLIREVSMSIDVAYQLCPLLEKYDIEFEVHADINTDPSFKSNVALKEAMGYILGMGFIFKAKPDAYASSSCADKVL